MLQSKSFVLIGLIKKKLKVTKTRMKNFLHAKTTSGPTRGPLRVAANALLAISTLEALSAVTHTHTHTLISHTCKLPALRNLEYEPFSTRPKRTVRALVCVYVHESYTREVNGQKPEPEPCIVTVI